MKPKLQLFNNSASFGNNNLSLNQFNKNYLELNYQFKFKSLNDSLNSHLQDQELNKTMEPIDLSIKSNRTSPEIISSFHEKKNKANNENDIDHQIVNHVDRTFSSKNIKSLGQNNAKLLPYLLMSNQNKLEKSLNNTDDIEKNLTNYQEVDLLRYNKKKLFLASERKRKQSSSTDNSNNSFYGNNLSFSSSSNSPNSTPPSSSSSTIINSTNQDLLKSNKKNNFKNNPPLSPISDNHSNEENYLDNYQFVKAKLLNKIQRNKLLNEANLLSENISFFKKNSSEYSNEKNEYKSYNNKQLNNFDKETNTSMCKKSNRCNFKSTINKCLSESNLLKLDLKRKNFNKNILKKWYSESELFEKKNKFLECNLNDEEQYITNKNFTLNSKRNQDIDDNLLQNSKNQTKEIIINNHILKNKYKLLQKKEHLNSQVINDKTDFYSHSKEEELINYTKKLLRANLNQKTNYQFCQNKSSNFNLPLNLQVNRNNTSLKFSNQMFVNTNLINNQCNKINKKTGKRKYTKLASDEDEDEEEDDDDEEDENEIEENIIVDNLPSNNLSSISPNSIQSLNENNSLIEKQLLAKHHLDHSNDHHLDQQSEDNGLDLRLPYLNHSSCLLPTNLQRRNVQNKSLNSSFGNLPLEHLLQNDNSNLSKNSNDDLASLKFYKNYYYLLLHQPDSPAKLDALKWMMKNLNEKNNNHISLNEEWAEQEILKTKNYADQLYSINNSHPLNLSLFGTSLKHQFSNNFNSLTSQRDHSQIIDQIKSHRSQQLLNTSRNHLNSDKYSVSPKNSLSFNLNCSQITPENYLQFLRMNESLSNSSNNSNSQLQIVTGQNFLNLDNSMIPGTPNSLQDRKRISRPLTGRHVRQGTGASPTTLANLRTMIKERQKFKEMGGNLGVNNGKKFRKKRK